MITLWVLDLCLCQPFYSQGLETFLGAWLAPNSTASLPHLELLGLNVPVAVPVRCHTYLKVEPLNAPWAPRVLRGLLTGLPFPLQMLLEPTECQAFIRCWNCGGLELTIHGTVPPEGRAMRCWDSGMGHFYLYV